MRHSPLVSSTSVEITARIRQLQRAIWRGTLGEKNPTPLTPNGFNYLIEEKRYLEMQLPRVIRRERRRAKKRAEFLAAHGIAA